MIQRLSAQVETDLLSAIREKVANVGIVGMGYVGLPLAKLFSEHGFAVRGFDVDEFKVDALNQGRSYIRQYPESVIATMKEDGRFRATADMSELAQMEAVLICVPTPLARNRDPDLTYVESTARSIRDALRPGQLVVLESTTYPGTTRDVVKPILEQSGLQCGADFFLAYSPEREDPGNSTHSAAFIPKVVGGLDEESLNLACELYRHIVPQVVPVSSAEIAEACKILENTYRCVNIALVNELKVLFEKLDIDIWEVVEAAKTKPFGFQAFYPGPGLGGHCIPIDPFYLSWLARQHNTQAKFIELAGEVNIGMVDHVIQRVLLALNSQGKAVRGARVCVLGMAYKKDVDDARESPSLELIAKLESLGAEVSYNDPYIPRIGPVRKHDVELHSQDLSPEFLRSLDCVLIATDHSCYDIGLITDHAPLVVDSRNATRKVKAWHDNVWAA